MVTPTDFSIWLREQAWPIGIILGAVILTYIALVLSARRRRSAMSRTRAGVTEQTFADYLSQFGFDTVIATSTYRYLQQVQKISFPILPGDSLDEDLGLDLDDVEQAITDLTAALNRERNLGLVHAPLVTVEDLIRLLQASPRIAKVSVA